MPINRIKRRLEIIERAKPPSILKSAQDARLQRAAAGMTEAQLLEIYNLRSDVQAGKEIELTPAQQDALRALRSAR